MNSEHPTMHILDGAAGLRFVHLDYANALQMPLHTHEDTASLNLCLRGNWQEIRHETRKQQTLHQGATGLSLMPAGIPHSNQFAAGTSIFLMVLGAPWIQRLRQVSTVLDSPFCCHKGRPAWIATRMYREFLRRDALTPLALEGMLLELVAEIAREESISSPSDAPRWLREATDFVHAHFTERVTAEAVALAASVHPSHLMRAFHHRYGCTIGEYVRRLRIEYACHLLADSDIPIGQIALETGFCDQGHFGRTFKASTGISPGKFRRS